MFLRGGTNGLGSESKNNLTPKKGINFFVG